MTRRVLVTGSTGYLGSHLVRRLLQEPDVELYGLARQPDNFIPVEHSLVGDLLAVDLSSWLSEICPDRVFHMLGISPKAPFEEQLRIHAEGTRRLLQTLYELTPETQDFPHVVIAGSAAEYGLRDEPVDEESTCQPEGEYGIAKLMQTQIAQLYARRYQLPIVTGRVFNVYGHTDRHLVVASLAAQIAEIERAIDSGAPSESLAIRAHNLASWRDFVHIDDVTEALLALGNLESLADKLGQIYNVASGHSSAIGTVLDILLSHSVLSESQREHLEVIAQSEQREDISWADISKIRQRTGWEPRISLREGLKQELEAWRERLIARPVNVQNTV